MVCCARTPWPGRHATLSLDGSERGWPGDRPHSADGAVLNQPLLRRDRRGLFDLVLGPCRRGRLPLHVAGRIGAAALLRYHVIDHVAFARPRGLASRRTGVRRHEGPAGGRRALDSAAAVAHAGSAPRRRRSGACDGGAALRSSRRSWRTPRRRAGAAAPGGSPRRCCTDHEAERDDELSDHHACSIGGLRGGQ